MERRSPLTLFHQLVNCAIRRNRLMQRGLWSGEKSRMSREGAPRHAVLNSWPNQGEFGRILSGHPIYLKAKARGENSMSEKRDSLEGVYGAVLQDLRDMAKAGLPEAQFPAVEPHTRCHNASGQRRPEQAIKLAWSVPSA